jgi:beta-glucosidase
MRNTGLRWTFSPVLGNPQDPHWGRTYECFSENIEIVAEVGPAYIRGFQSSGDAIVTMKHYLGEGQTPNGKNQGNAILTEQEVRDLLLPYRKAVEAGALTIVFFSPFSIFYFLFLFK